MTLAQRLTRAGLAFIVFGTAVALFPTNGNASAATDGCTTFSQSYSVGTSAGDTTSTFSTSQTLGTFLGSSPADATSVADGNSTDFTTSISGTTVTTTQKTSAAKGEKETVSILFPGSRSVTYTVTAS